MRSSSLHTRLSLLLTALAATLLLALGGLWLHAARSGIHEEVEAAARVSEQWLTALASEARGAPAAGAVELPTQAGSDDGASGLHPAHRRLLTRLRSLGRIRANALEVVAASGERLYVSPPSAYKAGRMAPAWFAQLAEPIFAMRQIDAGGMTLLLRPDPSRAVLDAWDELRAMAGWAAALLGALFVAVRAALAHALRPLGEVVAALDRTARSGADFRLDARLPTGDALELDRIARAFNGMADRLAQAVDENVRLEADREFAHRLQAGLEEERRAIARELHDELSQGITAVRALAGAIAQRSTDRPTLLGPAQRIVDVTGDMQDGVRAILHRLRPQVAGGSLKGLVAALQRHGDAWREQHPQVVLALPDNVPDVPLAEAVAQAALRVVQEALTNVARHAGASHVDIGLTVAGGWLELCVVDDGCGPSAVASRQPGCGLGLSGMAERTAALGGEIQLGSRPGGGFRVVVRLPLMQPSNLPGTFVVRHPSEERP